MSRKVKLTLSVLMISILIVLGIKSLNIKQDNLSKEDNQTKFDARGLITAIEKYNDKTQGYFFNTDDGGVNWLEIDSKFFPEIGSSEYILLTDSDISVLNKVIIERIVGRETHMRLYSEDLDSGMYVCYLPLSLAYSQEASYRCRGSLPAGFPSQACEDTENPWYCIPF